MNHLKPIRILLSILIYIILIFAMFKEFNTGEYQKAIFFTVIITGSLIFDKLNEIKDVLKQK